MNVFPGPPALLKNIPTPVVANPAALTLGDIVHVTQYTNTIREMKARDNTLVTDAEMGSLEIYSHSQVENYIVQALPQTPPAWFLPIQATINQINTSIQRNEQRSYNRARNMNANQATHPIYSIVNDAGALPAVGVLPATKGALESSTVLALNTLCDHYGIPRLGLNRDAKLAAVKEYLHIA